MRRTATLMLVVAAAACRSGVTVTVEGEDAGVKPSSPPTGLRIDGVGDTLRTGEVAQLHVIALYAGGLEAETQDATVTSSAPAIAAIDPAARALKGLSRGDAQLVATLKTPALTAQRTVHVVNPGGDTTVQIQVAPSRITLAPGFTQQLEANATQGDGSQLGVTRSSSWTASDPAVCSVDDGAQKGLVRAVAAGQCVVTARYGALSSSAQIAVAPVTIASLSVAPASLLVAKGAVGRLVATATLSDGTARDATADANWTSADPAVATVTAGAVSGITSGSTTVTATLAGQSAKAAVRVDAATLAGISVTPPSFSLPLGLAQACTATASYSDGTTADATALVAWTSDTPATATVDAQGVVRGATRGRAKITATLSGVSGSALVNITDATLTALALLPTQYNLPLGSQQQAHAVGTFSDKSVREVTASVAWSIGDPSIATVNAGGNVSSLAKGQTQLSAALLGLVASAQVTVTDATLAQLLVFPVSAVLPAGLTAQLFATGVYSDNTLHDVTAQATWTSSSDAVATASNDAGSRGLVTGVTQGTAQVTAALGAVTSNPSTVQVTAASLIAVRLAPRGLVIPQYITAGVRLFARYTDGTEYDETTNATLVSSAPQVASVTRQGLVTGITTGGAQITGTLSGLSAVATVKVVDAPLVSLQVIALRNDMKVGDAQQLRAFGMFQGAPRAVDVTPLCTWTTSATQVAAIDPRTPGLLVARAPGAVTANAQLNGIVGAHDFKISSVAISRLEVLEAQFTLPVGLTRTLIAKATYADGSVADVSFGATWSSDRNGVALVSDSLQAKGTVTGVAAGTAHITAMVSGLSASSSATVNNARAVTLTISPVDTVVNSGGGPFRASTVAYAATAHFDDGNDYNVTNQTSWFSSDASVAAISNNGGSKGRADVVGIGVSTITAKYGTLSISTTLTSR